MSKTFGNTPNYGPHYFFEIGSYDTFHKDLKDAQLNWDEEEKVVEQIERRKDVFGDILSWILPLAFFIFNIIYRVFVSIIPIIHNISIIFYKFYYICFIVTPIHIASSK